MRDKSPAFQWYPKQYLGDDDVLAMDWDARGMHVHLLNIAYQQEPPGSLPNDMALIRRWLSSPLDDVWRRVRPQIFSAWIIQDGRWFNKGLLRSVERQSNYNNRYRKSTEKSAKFHEDEDVLLVSSSRNVFQPPSLGEVIAYCQERKNGVDPEKWFNYYTANGWKVGRNAMKDWRAAVRTWEKNGWELVHETRLSKAEQRQQSNLRAREQVLRELGNRPTNNSSRSVRGECDPCQIEDLPS